MTYKLAQADFWLDRYLNALGIMPAYWAEFWSMAKKLNLYFIEKDRNTLNRTITFIRIVSDVHA